MGKKIEEITGLKKPTQEDFRFPISENDEELMINYAYGLLDYAEDLERYIEKTEDRNSKIFEYIKNRITEAYELSEKATDLNNEVTSLLESYDPCQDHVKQHCRMFNTLHDQWWNALLRQNKILRGLLTSFGNNFRWLKKGLKVMNKYSAEEVQERVEEWEDKYKRLEEKYNYLKDDYADLKNDYDNFKRILIEKLENMKRDEYDDRDEAYNIGIEHCISEICDTEQPLIWDVEE